MDVNLKGAAQNAHLGLKELLDLLESARDGRYDKVDELLDDVDILIAQRQPLLACYCLDEYFSNKELEQSH
jgi:hypothetical protein